MRSVMLQINKYDDDDDDVAYDFQHGYRMWTWFVNFLDKKKQKLILKTEHQFNTSV